MSCDQAQEDKPKWLLELENRKRKPKLAHETGAGAPCLICEDSCPGLELHFWRKICKICKCRGDDHVIDDEDFPQFELLFGPNTKNRKNRSFALKINQKLQPHSPPTNFEWIPPNTTEELAADYMKSLPADKWPIASSAGAAVRRQQLKKQLPLHDIDHKACDALSEQERKEFDKYLDNLKNCAGQGRVLKFSIIKPFDKSLMTPANATDVQRNSPQHSQSLSNNNGAGLSLRTPSSFIPKVPYSSSQAKSNLLPNYAPSEENRPITPIKDAMRTTTTHLQASHEQSPMGYYHQHHGGDGDRLQQQLDDVPRAAHGRSVHAYGGAASPSHLEHVRNRAMMADQDSARTGAAHHHYHHQHPTTILPNSDYVQAQIDRIAAAQSGNKLENSSGLAARGIRSETHPLDRASPQPSKQNSSADAYGNYPGSFDDYAQRYEGGSNDNNGDNVRGPVIHGALQHSSVYPSMSISSEEARLDPERISGLSNRAENNRTTNAYHPDYLQARISSSLPVHSSTIQSELLNNPVFPEETVGGGATFVQQNPDNIKQLQEGMEAMTMNTSEARHCYKCKAGIVSGAVVVTADKIKNAVWHPECFTCTACSELLVDLIYFTHKGNLYCARDLAELLEIPRCFACDELIFVREYTVAEGHNYHVKHFCCWDCDIPLAGLQYVSENDRPLCLPCYQNNYAKMCAACRTVIAADQKGIAIKNLNFHATETCFCCATCRKSLLEGQLAVKDDKILCSKECIAEYLHRKAMGR